MEYMYHMYLRAHARACVCPWGTIQTYQGSTKILLHSAFSGEKLYRVPVHMRTPGAGYIFLETNPHRKSDINIE